MRDSWRCAAFGRATASHLATLDRHHYFRFRHPVGILLRFEHVSRQFCFRTRCGAETCFADISNVVLDCGPSCLRLGRGNALLVSFAVASSETDESNPNYARRPGESDVLSDGSYLYVSETSERRHIISKVAVNGTGPSTLALPFAGAIGHAIAPDRFHHPTICAGRVPGCTLDAFAA